LVTLTVCVLQCSHYYLCFTVQSLLLVFYSAVITTCVLKVCGLKWSPDHQHLASGGNDNKLFVWNLTSGGPVQTYTDHQAAVKAISWSPHQHGLLASGGGTADRCVRFWNTLTGQPLQCVDTGSQVCNLAWSKHSNELVSISTVHQTFRTVSNGVNKLPPLFHKQIPVRVCVFFFVFFFLIGYITCAVSTDQYSFDNLIAYA
jgi:WD40 repeat protein